MPADGVLFQSEYLTVRLEYDGRLVRVIRSALLMPDPETAERAFAPLFALFDRIDRHGRCLLTDMRLAPGRNDPAFEVVLSSIRLRMMVGFERIGTLVQSKVGLLHLSRLIREDRVERMASSDEKELLSYLGLSQP